MWILFSFICGIENSLFATLIMEATEFVFELKALNLKIKGVLNDHTIAMVICTVRKMVITCSLISGNFFSAVMPALTEKEGYYWQVNVELLQNVGNCCCCCCCQPLKLMLDMRKMLSCCLGQVDFTVWQGTSFLTSPMDKRPRQAVHWLNFW